MKKYFPLLILLIVGVLSCKSEQNKKVEQEEVTSEAKSSFEDLDGNPVELTDFKGKRVLLNYWATWCRPCIDEMPAMSRAQKALENDNYVFLFASDQSLGKIKAFKEKKQFDLTFLKFNGSLADMKINTLPATFIYNETGKFMNRIDGAIEWDSPRTLDKLRALK